MASHCSCSIKEKGLVIGKTLLCQVVLFLAILGLMWGSLKVYSSIDQVSFPTPMALPANPQDLDEKTKGKLLLDSITNQMRYELKSTFGWTCNDILFNKYVLDNRAYRQYGVYHATKILMDLYSMSIAKLGSSDKESQFLYEARINSFSIDPRSFMFPSAEGSYEKGLKKCEQYKKSLDNGTGVYNIRTDDIYASLSVAVSDNLLGYALGLLRDSQKIPFYRLDNHIYEAQGIVLVVRDFLHTLYMLYPEIKEKKNQENMEWAMKYLDKICTYNPLYITSDMNCGELIVAQLTFAISRLNDIKSSLRI